ncbi:hypothetical protein GCK72_018964 [Caenorhabditis remanei]|uniref:Uncharacterized protein n=1 Tax=Caenorhabditis remanei TaxID=31234 RepID=A0A6A5GDB4_CAERE|nr:hypothetical protein GCK72_018964 [Caenorhabditis remanei]KAF1752409.1 hypothetical protein GCK72_018964 [Caenorhabditis remanei]
MLKYALVWIFVAFLVSVSFGFDDKEDEIDCVISCGDDVEEWKDCAAKCYGGFMDDSDNTFLACETDCVDRFYKPDVEESELTDLEECAQKCVDDYLQDEGGKKKV